MLLGRPPELQEIYNICRESQIYYCELYFMFMHRALWYNYAAYTNEMHTFQINTLIQFFDVFYVFRTSWVHTQ